MTNSTSMPQPAQSNTPQSPNTLQPRTAAQAAAASMTGALPGRNRILDTQEVLDRLAIELRARTGGEQSHEFYVEEVKRRLAGQGVPSQGANDAQPTRPTMAARTTGTPATGTSVFHAWALGE